MALRKEDFDYTHERARTMENSQQSSHQDSVFIEVDRRLYYRIRFVSEIKRITMRQYVGQILDEMVPEIADVAQPGHPPTREIVEQLRTFREQVWQENNYQDMGNSVEELRAVREERLQQLAGDEDANQQ